MVMTYTLHTTFLLLIVLFTPPGILQNDYFFSKTLSVQTKNASGIEWFALGELSAYGTAGSISACYPNPEGFSLENFRIKVQPSQNINRFPSRCCFLVGWTCFGTGIAESI
jgi:hypothetical protein